MAQESDSFLDILAGVETEREKIEQEKQAHGPDEGPGFFDETVKNVRKNARAKRRAPAAGADGTAAPRPRRTRRAAGMPSPARGGAARPRNDGSVLADVLTDAVLGGITGRGRSAGGIAGRILRGIFTGGSSARRGRTAGTGIPIRNRSADFTPAFRRILKQIISSGVKNGLSSPKNFRNAAAALGFGPEEAEGAAGVLEELLGRGLSDGEMFAAIRKIASEPDDDGEDRS